MISHSLVRLIVGEMRLPAPWFATMAQMNMPKIVVTTPANATIKK